MAGRVCLRPKAKLVSLPAIHSLHLLHYLLLFLLFLLPNSVTSTSQQRPHDKPSWLQSSRYGSKNYGTPLDQSNVIDEVGSTQRLANYDNSFKYPYYNVPRYTLPPSQPHPPPRRNAFSNYGSQSYDSSYDNDLKTAPLTSTRNRTLSLFSKWGVEKKEIGLKSNSIESSLAAIFRGVAYGVSSAPTTTTPVPTTTEPTTLPTVRSTTTANVISKSVEESSLSKTIEGSDTVLKAVYRADSVYSDGENYDVQNGETPLQNNPTTSPTEVRRAGVNDWQSNLEGAWEVHVYCSAASFCLLSVMSFLCIVRVRISEYLLPTGYYVTAHVLVFLASLFRCIIFFLDPYASYGKLPTIISDIFFNIGVPCVTAAFSIVVLALLNGAKILLLPLNLQSPLAFGMISAVYVCGSIIVDILAGLYSQYEWSSALRASVQALTAGWTGAMCLGYMIIFYRIEKNATRQRSDQIRISCNRDILDNSTIPRRSLSLSLGRGARLILVASFCGMAVAVLQVYGLMSTDTLLELPPNVPWLWFGYQTSCRLLEIIMWSCVCVAAALSLNSSPVDKTISKDQGMTVFSCKDCTGCSDISSCQESHDKKRSVDLYPKMCQTNNTMARNFSVDLNGKIIIGDVASTTPFRNCNTVSTKDKEKNGRASSTLHSATSDMHLLWGGHTSNSSSSRPTSMVYNENGQIKFKSPMDNGEYQGTFSSRDAIPPGYIEHLYNNRKDDYSRREHTYNEPDNDGHMQQFLHTKIAREIYERIRLGKGPPNSDASEQNTEYSLSEVASSIPNDEYARYASACSSVSAENSFDIRMYDDYEVASYYHSPLSVPKSSNSHVYASLRPTNTNMTPRRMIRNARVPNSSCFSSPKSGASSDRSNMSPRTSNHLHNSDSDLCSSATDRTRADSSQGNQEDISEKYDNLNSQRFYNMRRKSSPQNSKQYENQTLDNRESVKGEVNERLAGYIHKLKRSNTGPGYISAEGQYPLSEDDDMYTPLMDQHQQITQVVTGNDQRPQNINKIIYLNQLSYLQSEQQQQQQHSSQFNHQNLGPKVDTVHSYYASSNVAQKEPTTEASVPKKNKTSPYKCNPMTSPEKNIHTEMISNNQVVDSKITNSQEQDESSLPNNHSQPIDPSPGGLSQSVGKGNETLVLASSSNDVENDKDSTEKKDIPSSLANYTRPPPPALPVRPSLLATARVLQDRDGSTRSEVLSCHKKQNILSPTSTSPLSPISNV